MNQADASIERNQAEALLASIARTNVQLYNQLQAQGRTSSELTLVRRAYELAAQLYSAAYQADGKPFVTHVVSVASAMALLGASAEAVAAALLHNVYNNADFGDGRRRRVDDSRRQLIRDAVGDSVEARVSRFAELRVERSLDRLLASATQLDAADRELVVMDLADVLEKHLDGGVLYFGDSEWVTQFATRRLADLQALARTLDQKVLAEAIGIAVRKAAAMQIDPVLRSSPDRRYLHYRLPLSARTGLLPAWRSSRLRNTLVQLLRSARSRTRDSAA